jgi:hypothetical protein
VEWDGYPAGAYALNELSPDVVYGFSMNGTPVDEVGRAKFIFEDLDNDGQESFTFRGRNGASSCETTAVVSLRDS